MKQHRQKLPSCGVISTGILLFACSLHAQTTHSQFFNNNNPSFTDTVASLYNWEFATANAVTTLTNNISAGNTKSGGEELDGEEARGRGFFFVLPGVGEQPGATVMYTTYMGTSAHIQNNPQPRWFRSGDSAIKGRTVSEIQSILISTRCGTAMNGRVGIQINGTDWLFSSVETAFGSSAWVLHTETNLTVINWITGGFVGNVLDADLSDNPTTTLTGTEAVTGYAVYADTESLAGGDARVRLNEMIVTVQDPAQPPQAPGVQVAISGGSDMELSFDSLSGQYYELEKSIDSMTTWDTILDLQNGTGSTLTFEDTGSAPSSGDKVFYRVAATN